MLQAVFVTKMIDSFCIKKFIKKKTNLKLNSIRLIFCFIIKLTKIKGKVLLQQLLVVFVLKTI